MEGQKPTVVGLPRKCLNHGKSVPFMKKMPTEKEKVSTLLHSILIIKLLSYFEVVCRYNVVDSAIKGSLINEDNVEVCPETISCSCLDENICTVELAISLLISCKTSVQYL